MCGVPPVAGDAGPFDG